MIMTNRIDFRHGMSSLVFRNNLDFGSKINMLKGFSFSIANIGIMPDHQKLDAIKKNKVFHKLKSSFDSHLLYCEVDSLKRS